MANVNGQEEIDIDLTDPEVQKAASKIQAGFRGHQVRKDVKDKAPANPTTDDDDIADIDLTDPDLADAALKIQAGFRGHLSRKVKDTKKETQDDLNKKMANLNTEEELDIDLNDPEMEKAATKIQATFRGHKSRKEDV